MAATGGGALGGGLLEARFEPLRESGELLPGQLGFVLGGHFAFVKLVEDFVPVSGAFPFVEFGREGVDAELALLFLRPMALDAVLFHEWTDLLVVYTGRGTRFTKCGGGQEGEAGKRGWGQESFHWKAFGLSNELGEVKTGQVIGKPC